MTATTLTTAPRRRTPLDAIVAAEWIKLRTVRANAITVAIALVASIGLSALAVSGQRDSWSTMSAAERAAFDPVSLSLVGAVLSTLVLGSFAVRAITSEQGTGMARTTFSAMPHRRLVLAAKTGLVVAVTVAVTLVTDVVSFELGRRILDDTGVAVEWGDPGVNRAVVFGALGVGLFSAIAISLGVILRRATTANILLALLVIGGQLIGNALPDDTRRYLPSAALEALVTTNRRGDTLAAGPALLVLVTFTVAMVAIATQVIARRDP